MIAMLSEARAADGRNACRGRALRSTRPRERKRRDPSAASPKPSRTSRPQPPPSPTTQNQQADRSGEIRHCDSEAFLNFEALTPFTDPFQGGQYERPESGRKQALRGFWKSRRTCSVNLR